MLAAVAAGCSSTASAVDAPLSPTFGVAVASLQAQIVPATTDGPLTSSAARGASAIRRYERGEPKTMGDYATSNVSSIASGNAAVGAGGSSLDK
jgi:hypothetical protein